MLTGETDFATDFAHLVELCRYHRISIPEPAKHYSADFGSYSLKWERHGGFTTYTFFHHGGFAHPFDGSVLTLVPQNWIESLPGQRLVWKICGACRNQFRHQIANAKPCTENPNW